MELGVSGREATAHPSYMSVRAALPPWALTLAPGCPTASPSLVTFPKHHKDQGPSPRSQDDCPPSAAGRVALLSACGLPAHPPKAKKASPLAPSLRDGGSETPWARGVGWGREATRTCPHVSQTGQSPLRTQLVALQAGSQSSPCSLWSSRGDAGQQRT